MYCVYSKKLDKFWGGNGFRDAVPYFLVTKYDDPMEAQECADAFNLVQSQWDHEEVKKLENQICDVRNLMTGKIWTPPPFLDIKNFAVRETKEEKKAREMRKRIQSPDYEKGKIDDKIVESICKDIKKD